MITRNEIEKMDYNQLIGVVKETNRPPGGFRSILHVARDLRLSNDSKVLEIGTSTGITAIELAKLSHCSITAIDINPVSLEEARERAKSEGVDDFISFELQDATNLDYEDNSFDVVFCGNVTSLIENRDKALSEYRRILKPNGFLVAIPMYYVKEPSTELLDKVRNAIKVNIIPWDKKFWVDFFVQEKMEYLYEENYVFDNLSSEVVTKFANDILKRPHLKELDNEAMACLRDKYTDYMMIFRDNLSHMGYTIMYLRKTELEIDSELFTSCQVQ